EEYAFAMGKVLVNTDKNYTLIANGTIIGDQPDEEVKEILEMMYKVSDYIVERDEFSDLVKDERAAAKERAEQAAKEEKNTDASPSHPEALQKEKRLLPSKNEDEIR
ncbi:MAG: hypothetical protein IJX59_05525, partial [Clostridia bacterium]|nr:hypothetical protein [Clostridia bacterium]